MNRRQFIKRGSLWVPAIAAFGFPNIVEARRRWVPKIAAAGGGGPTPLGQWKLNEGTGTNAADSGSGGNAGTLTGGPTWGTGGNSNGDVVFDGVDDYIAIANESAFDFERTSPFSFTFNIKYTAGGGNRTIISKANTGGNQEGIEIHVDRDNERLKFFLVNTSGAAINVNTAGGSLTSGAWHFVAVTNAGTDQTGMKITIDGNAAVAGAAGTLAGTILNANPLWIGRGGASNFIGEADDVRAYAIELSAAQITTILGGGAQ